MTKWLIRLLVVVLLVAAFIYFFRTEVTDGKITIVPRSDNERNSLRQRVEQNGGATADAPADKAAPAPEKEAPDTGEEIPREDRKRVAKPQEAPAPEKEREALESILEESL